MARTKKQLIAAVTKVKNRIAKDRDEVRDLIEDLQNIAEDAGEAIDSLEDAADALSRYL